MKRFLEVEPTLMVTTLDPEYGDRYLRPSRFPPSLRQEFESADSYAKKFRFAIMAEARISVIETLHDYVRSGDASVEDILRLDEDRYTHMMLLNDHERALVAEEAADSVVLTCAESALKQDPRILTDYLWPETEEYAERRGIEHLPSDTLVLLYIEHCMMRLRGSDLMKAIAKL